MRRHGRGRATAVYEGGPVIAALRVPHEDCLVHTGEHYDAELFSARIDEAETVRPDIALGMHGGSEAEQHATADMSASRTSDAGGHRASISRFGAALSC